MSDLVKKKVRFTISKDGSYKMEALEGFAGSSCLEQTKNLELALGGHELGDGKTEDYYKDDEDPQSITINDL